MGLYEFKKQFVPFIRRGEKTHTIRGKRVYADKPGNVLHLYNGLRTKRARLIGRAICSKIEEIEIMDFPSGPTVIIAGAILDESESERLARRDGFSNFQEMMKFWKGRLPFVGDVIHWKDFSTRRGAHLEKRRAKR